MKTMRCYELAKIYAQNQGYLLLELLDGTLIGANSKMLNVIKRLRKYKPLMRTRIAKAYPCSLQAYITHKVPY